MTPVHIAAKPDGGIAYCGTNLNRREAASGLTPLYLYDDERALSEESSGPATMVDGEWDRPNGKDYAQAAREERRRVHRR